MFRTLAALALALILGLLGVLWLPCEAPAPTDPTGLQPAPASPEASPLLDPRQSVSERVIVEASRSASEETLGGATSTQAGGPGFLVRVQAPDGNPLPGAHVQWIGPEASVEGTSDVDGSCRLAWPPKGTRAELAVSAEGFFPHRQQYIATETKVTLYPLARLSGRVLDRESGAPIGGARLRVIWGRDGEPVVSDAAGRYDALAVPHGCSFPLSVEAHAYQQIIAPLILRADEPSPAHDVLLYRALVARFVVLDLTSGEPIAGALVQGRSATYTTNVEGLVEVDRSFRPADETHWVYVRASGHCSTDFELKDLDSLAAPIPLRVARSCRIEGVVLDPDGVAIRGIRVTASFDGEEFEWIRGSDGLSRPRSYPTWPPNARLDLSEPNHQAQHADELGKFAFDGFPAGLTSVQLEVDRDGAVLAHRQVGPLDAPGSIERVEIRLDPPSGAIVRGQLLLNGKPVSGRVSWQGATLEGLNDVGADGLYELVDVEAGPVTLIGEPQTREMTLPKAGWAERRIQLERGAQVECDLAAELSMSAIGGRVVGPDGEPYGGAAIRLGSQSPAGWFKSTSGEDGTWTAPVPQTDADFRVDTELVTQEGERVAHAGDRDVDFHVARSALLRYRAQVAGSGEPVARLWLSRRVDRDRFMTVGRPSRNPRDSEGWHQVELPEGEHEVFATVSGGEYQAAGHTVHLVASQVSEVVFELEPAFRLKLGLADGEPPLPAGYSVILVREQDWARVRAQRDGERIHWTWDGRVESPQAQHSFDLEQVSGRDFGGLAPGRYRFKVFPEDLLLEPAWIDVPAARELVELRWRLSR
jgi:hypothetical protein